MKQQERVAVPVEVVAAPLEHRVRLDAAAAVHREEHDALVVDVSDVLERLGEGRGSWRGRGAKVVLEIAGSRAAAGRGRPGGRARLGHDANRGRAGDESGRLPSRVWSVWETTKSEGAMGTLVGSKLKSSKRPRM